MSAARIPLTITHDMARRLSAAGYSQDQIKAMRPGDAWDLLGGLPDLDPEPTMLEAALTYAARGWAVFPCKPDKTPATLHGVKDATADTKQIARWWLASPDAAIGLACGPSGLVVVDCDVKGGVDGIANFAALGIDTPGTLESVTPSGGLHVVFADTTGGKVRNSVSKLAPGVDIRANGGYIIAPPSRVASGNYAAQGDWTRDPAPLPKDLAARLLPRKTPTRTQGGSSTPDPTSGGYGAAALADELAAIRAASEGTRNHTLNRAAFNLGQLVGGGELERQAVERELLAAAIDAGLPEGEAGKTLSSGLDAGMAQPRTRPVSNLLSGIQGSNQGGNHGSNQVVEAQVYEANQPQAAPVDLLSGIDDEGNAQAVAALYRGQFLHTTAYGWLRWVGTHWGAEDAEAHLDRAIVNTLQERRAAAVKAELEGIVKTARPTAARVKAARYMLESILRVNVNDFDADPDTLNVSNGVLNLKTGQLIPHDNQQRFTYCVRAEYQPNADRGPWLDFLSEVLNGDREIMTYLQDSVGYSLTGHTREEVLFYLHGRLRAGKGTFTETILALLGWRPLADEVDFATFTAERTGDTQNFDLADLKPCRFIAASESQRHSQLNAAKIKALTGGNLVRCARKYGNFFSYRPTFKCWLSSNHPVNADVDDDAAWGRLRVIHFPNSYEGREDKTLKERLLQPDALAGVLAWAVEGAQRWYASPEGLKTPAAVVLATKKAREELDNVGAWLAECAQLTSDPQAFTPNASLYQSYSAWCLDNGVTPKHKVGLSASLASRGVQTGIQKWANGRNQKGCGGIRLLS